MAKSKKFKSMDAAVQAAVVRIINDPCTFDEAINDAISAYLYSKSFQQELHAALKPVLAANLSNPKFLEKLAVAKLIK